MNEQKAIELATDRGIRVSDTVKSGKISWFTVGDVTISRYGDSRTWMINGRGEHMVGDAISRAVEIVKGA